jgi:16S rRNA (cytosine1402-N4)-methyltransferase
VENKYHTPVLLHDCIEGLAIVDGGIYVDVTFGGGGHSLEILKNLGSGKLFAFDQDEAAEKNVPNDDRLIFVRQVDGILADLGVSSHQFDEADRGFSTRFDSELDMRMDQDAELTARKIVEEYSEDDLFRVFRQGSDLKQVGRMVRSILAARSQGISSTTRLREVLAPCAPFKKPAQFWAQVFQALRIEVNDEMSALIDLLEQTAELIKPGGRLVVMSYHSLEDRLVKNFIRSGHVDGTLEKDFYGNPIKPFDAVNRKVIVPLDEEIELNNRARSAKLRIAKRQ